MDLLFKASVPLSFGKLIVLCAVGSTTFNVVSKESALEPSKITPPDNSTFENAALPPVTSVKNATVEPFWNVIVLSAVGSTTARVVSKLSAVEPSNTSEPVVVIVLDCKVPAKVTLAPSNVAPLLCLI